MSSKPDKGRYNEPESDKTRNMPGQSRQPGQQPGQPQQQDKPYDRQGDREIDQNKPRR